MQDGITIVLQKKNEQVYSKVKQQLVPDHKRIVKTTEHGAERGEQQAVEGSGLYMYVYNAQARKETIRSTKTLLNLLSLERCSSGHSYKAKENKVLRDLPKITKLICGRVGKEQKSGLAYQVSISEWTQLLRYTMLQSQQTPMCCAIQRAKAHQQFAKPMNEQKQKRFTHPQLKTKHINRQKLTELCKAQVNDEGLTINDFSKYTEVRKKKVKHFYHRI